MMLTQLAILLFSIVLTGLAVEDDPFDKFSSTFLSRLRFSLRDIDNELDKCVGYWNGIEARLNKERAQGDGTSFNHVDANLLVRIRDGLRRRKTAYGPSSLLQFTENCIETLEARRGKSSPPSNGALATIDVETNKDVQAKENDDDEEFLYALEEDNAKLRDELAKLRKEMDAELSRLRGSGVQDDCGSQLREAKAALLNEQNLRKDGVKKLMEISKKLTQLGDDSIIQNSLRNCQRDLVEATKSADSMRLVLMEAHATIKRRKGLL